MSRIQLTDTGQDILIKMSEGNPGALTAMMELMQKSPEIDPQDALGPFGPIMALDTHGIYGSSIYVLWSDKCQRDTRKMCMLLRSVQLGLFPEHKLQEMAADQCFEVNLSAEDGEDLDAKVCERLEDFQKAT